MASEFWRDEQSILFLLHPVTLSCHLLSTVLVLLIVVPSSKRRSGEFRVKCRGNEGTRAGRLELRSAQAMLIDVTKIELRFAFHTVEISRPRIHWFTDSLVPWGSCFPINVSILYFLPKRLTITMIDVEVLFACDGWFLLIVVSLTKPRNRNRYKRVLTYNQTTRQR